MSYGPEGTVSYGPEGLQLYIDAWLEDLARLEKCKKDMMDKYIPQITNLNARLTEAMLKIKELEEELEIYRSKD